MRKVSLVLLIGTAVAVAMLAWFDRSRVEPMSASVTPGDTVADANQINLRFGHNTPENSALHQAALRFARAVEKKSGNRVHVEVFPAQRLGNDHEMVEMAREGSLDIILTPTAKMSVPLPAMQYADLPFFFPSREDAYALLDGEPGRLLLDKLDSIDLVGVTFWENGFKHFTGNEPFLRPEDFEGKKIRVMKSHIIMEQFRALGAEPVPIDFHSTRQALADKVIDGQENPLVAIVSMGFHEVQSDLVLSEHAYLGYVFSISKKVFDGLPQDVRQTLIETAKEVTPWEREETRRREQALIETIREAGVRIHRLTPAQRQAFADKVSWIAKASEAVIGADVISKTEELLLEKYGPAPGLKEQVVIGLDADLSMDGGVAGLAIKRGIELAVADLNEQGGLLGKPVRLIARDHRVTASIGISSLNRFIQREDTVAVMGGKHSAVIAEEIPLIQKVGIPYLVPWAAVAELTDNGYEDNYVFRVSATDRYASTFLAKYLLEHHQKPAVVVENSIWGRSNMQRIVKYLEQVNVTPRATMMVNRGQMDFSKEMAELTSCGCDSVLLVMNSHEGAGIVKQLANTSSPLPVVSHWGIIGGKFYQQVRDVLPRIDLRFFQAYPMRDPRHPQRVALINRYRQVYAVPEELEVDAPMAVLQAYDLTHLLAQAVTHAGSTERDKVKQALEKLPPFKGAIKDYHPAFTPGDHDALGDEDYYMARFGDNGTIEPVTD